jgi:lysophospholipase L1-like esterase
VPGARVQSSKLPAGVPTGYWRAPGDNGNTWATQFFIDELAHAAGRDPLAFTLDLLAAVPASVPTGGRGGRGGGFDAAKMTSVLKLAAEKAGWGRTRPRGEGQGFQPKAIMLMIGTNNYTTCTSAEIAEGVGAVVLELRKDFPAAKILLLGIFPRGTPGDVARRTVQDVNPIIAKLHDGQHVFYLDIGAKFLTADGTLEKSVMPDLLHLNAASYKVEADAIRDKLASLAK